MENNDPKLVELVILPMKTFGEAEVERLANSIASGNNTHLQSISASGHSIPPSGLAQLGNALASQSGSRICHMGIGDENMKDEGVESLCLPLVAVNGASLESLDLAFKGVSAVGAGMVGRAFGKSKNIRQLDLYRNPGIGNEGMIAFSEAAIDNDGKDVSFEALQHLDISECDVGAEGMKALVNCLTTGGGDSRRSSLLALQASSNPFGAEGCSHLKDLIPRLKSVSLKKCSIGDDGIIFLVEAFETSGRGFGVLDVAGNGIGMKGVSALAEALAKHQYKMGLTELNLADNSIGDDGVVLLAKALKQNVDNDNAKIQVLDLSSTKCGINGAVELLKCPSLKSIRLFNNNLASEGFEAITPLLEGGHATLEHLDLGGNRAKESAVAGLLRAIMVKNEPDDSALRTIELGGNEVGEEVEEILKEMMIVRPELDIARDRPSVAQPNEPNDVQEGEMTI